MAEPLLYPAVYLIARYLLNDSVTRVLAARLATARIAAVRIVNDVMVSALVNVAVTVMVLLAVVFGLRGRLAERELVLAVATVYAASVLHGGIRVALNAWWIADLAGYLWRHGVRGPKAWVRAQVRRQVDAHFARLGWWRRFAYRFSGAPPPAQLAELITHEVWTVVTARVVATTLVVAAYLAIFVLYTRPILITEATRLNWLQAFLWPFGFSVDYFLHTRTTDWIASALRF